MRRNKLATRQLLIVRYVPLCLMSSTLTDATDTDMGVKLAVTLWDGGVDPEDLVEGEG